MADAFIFDALRTPRAKGKAAGALHTLSPLELLTRALAALRERTGLDPALVEDVVAGCAEAANDQGANLSRAAALMAGYGDQVPGLVVSRYCGSGLDAVNTAAARVMAGQADLIVAAGIEMMSVVPMFSTGGPVGTDFAFNTESWLTPQGLSADLIATKYGYSRGQLDAYAAESQRRAARAWDEGRFARSVIPVHDDLGRLMADRDEHLRPGITEAELGALKPSFAAMGEKGGFAATIRQRYPEVGALDYVHHAGNSSGIVDGAAAMLIGTREAGRALGLEPRARIASFSSVGSEPCIMLTGPRRAVEKCLARSGAGLTDIDLFEVNEAFAAVPVHFMAETGVPHGRVNVNGGAIAMGHPLGASGVILVNTLLDELERSGGQRGIAAFCVGVGMGVATQIERVN